MKVYQAMYQAYDSIKTVLGNAGLVDGTSLSPEQLKSSKKTLYWHLTVKSEEASKKQIYVTYELLTAAPLAYGSGKPIAYDVTIQLNIFTTKENIRTLIEKINDESEAKHWRFDLIIPPTYESQLKLYIYTFNLKLSVAEVAEVKDE